MNTKKTLAAALAATTMFGLVGCGSSSSSNTTSTKKAEDKALTATMTVWSPQEDQSKANGNWLKKECEAFAKEHPKWKLTFKYGVCSEADAGKKVTQDVSGSADVYMYANDQLGTLIDAKALAQLGGDTLSEVKSTNSSTMLKSVTSDGKVYGIPFTGNTWFMYYNKAKFSSSDIKSLDTMLKKGKVAFPVSNSWYLGSFYVANGGTIFGDGSKAKKGIQFGGDKGYATTKTLVDLVNNKNFSDDANGSGLSALRNKKVDAYFSGSWDYDAVKKALGKNFGAAQLPTVKIDGKDQQLKSFAGSKAIGVNPNSKNMEVAVKLAAYLGGEKAQKDHYTLRSIIPCNTKLLKESDIKSDPLIAAQNNTINNTSILQPTITEMGNYWTPVETFGKALVAKQVNASNYKKKTDAFQKSLNTDVTK
ncbi:ABC transporter substrate-binding protein [Intestinibaculum porci]|uniref:ABC transporter substrate-binding protein n=1 Tax=Intestinibaculum porci TaxID=2487118 RepID=A0A3G9J2C8_9FIRM|nr:extracellular solute-binding protein [Intestinibaculum porci]BBH25330.1 ABC transporter substrate-binding protein [Intestinibaculum porci]